MATVSEMVTLLDSAISAVLTDLAAGKFVTEYNEGPIRVKKESPTDLLKELRAQRDAFMAEADTQRRPGVCSFGGAM